VRQQALPAVGGLSDGAYTRRMPFDLGPWELVILVGALVLLFGAKGVPDIARRLGTGVREVKSAVDDVDPRRMLDPGDETRRKTTARPNDSSG
jgi:sec-independent protein translocase protein TatA